MQLFSILTLIAFLSFEDKFRYDTEGVPRIWRPTDDIESVYTNARASTLTLIPLISRFHLSSTSSPPPLEDWIGPTPTTARSVDEEDLHPIGGIDEDSGITFMEETTILSDSRAADIAARFKKTADGVYVEAKRSAIGGVAQVPLYFWGLVLALGWNEMVAVLRSPLYFITLAVLGVAAYAIYYTNMAGPMIRMGDAALHQGIQIGKEKLREFLEAQEGSGAQRRPIAMQGRDAGSREEYEMSATSPRPSDQKDEDEDI